MTCSDTTCATPARTADSPCASTQTAPARPALPMGWLARATAVAVLMSGLNALVQMLRVFATAFGRGG